jgi:catechol 2,3-dioxygenase-like lactoylglutathione lyase family enzyme
MAKPSKLAHVVYMTRRYDEMISWYKTVFEARVQYENPAFAFLTYDDEHHRFAFANMDVISPNAEAADVPSGVGVNHVGYTFANAGELLETGRRSEADGVIKELEKRYAEQSADGRDLAVAYAAFDKDQAFAWLEKAFANHSVFLAFLKLEPLLEPLQSDARWNDLERGVGLTQ